MPPFRILLKQWWWTSWWQPELLKHANSCQIVTTNKPTPNFFTGRIMILSPNCRVIALKRESITFHELYHPKLTWSFPTLSSSLKAPDYLGEGYRTFYQPLSNLSILFDEQLSMADHITAVCRSCFFPAVAAPPHPQLLDYGFSQDTCPCLHQQPLRLLQ